MSDAGDGQQAATWTCATRRHEVRSDVVVLRTTDRDDRDPVWRAVGAEMAGAHRLTHEELDSLLLTGRLVGDDGGVPWWLESLAVTDRQTGRLLGTRTLRVEAPAAGDAVVVSTARWWLPRTDPAPYAAAEVVALVAFAHGHLGADVVRAIVDGDGGDAGVLRAAGFGDGGAGAFEHRSAPHAACPAMPTRQ